MLAKDSQGKPIIGTMMCIEEDPLARYRFEVWFDYTRDVINSIGEGAMITVPNFYLDPRGRDHEWASVLEITTILPIHYAIGQTMSGFPGFLEEAARSAGQDWIDQENEATDDTTKIRCIAIPTNLMMDDDGDLQQEQGLPMVGHPARLLDTETTEKLANLGIDAKADHVARIGPLLRDKDVSIYVRIEEALKTHFAVFGFTGAGKSNLLSTIVAKFLADGSGPPVKLVVFDLMSEFAALLIDLLAELPHAGLVAVGPETLPDSVLEYYEQPVTARATLLNKAAEDLAKTTLYPKGLKARRTDFTAAFAKLLADQRVRVWQERARTIGSFVGDRRDGVSGGNMGGSKAAVRDLLDQLETDFAAEVFTDPAVGRAVKRIQQADQSLTSTASNNLRELIRLINAEHARLKGQRQAPADCQVKIPGLVQRLNAEDGSSLIVVQAADPDELRTFACNLGNAIYESRRRSGQIAPLVSFIFDEADEFIPLNVEKDSSYARSTSIAHTLARRGRKFGLGIGIATQRVTYLNTSIMAQPHTYFVSKLPRKTDRERVCEAFGISEDMFRQTFKFRKGDWLLVSHEATGLESVPLPVHTENADERVLRWLDGRKQAP